MPPHSLRVNTSLKWWEGGGQGNPSFNRKRVLRLKSCFLTTDRQTPPTSVAVAEHAHDGQSLALYVSLAMVDASTYVGCFNVKADHSTAHVEAICERLDYYGLYILGYAAEVAQIWAYFLLLSFAICLSILHSQGLCQTFRQKQSLHQSLPSIPSPGSEIELIGVFSSMQQL